MNRMKTPKTIKIQLYSNSMTIPIRISGVSLENWLVQSQIQQRNYQYSREQNKPWQNFKGSEPKRNGRRNRRTKFMKISLKNSKEWFPRSTDKVAG